MKRLRLVVVLGVLPALALGLFQHWEAHVGAASAATPIARARARIHELRVIQAQIDGLESRRHEFERLVRVIEDLNRRNVGRSPALLAALVPAAEAAGLRIESAWVQDGFLEVAGSGPSARAARSLAQGLEETGLVKDVDLWRCESGGAFALLARLPSAGVR